MKLLVGNPGKIDGWIPPPKVMSVPVNELMKLLEPHPDGPQMPDYPVQCSDKTQVRLFNITADPYEKNNIARENPEIVMDMTRRLMEYHRTMIPPDIHEEIEAGNPNLHGGFWVPGWCKSEPHDNTINLY